MSEDRNEFPLVEMRGQEEVVAEPTEVEAAEAEKIAREIVRRAVSLTGVRIDREAFFRTELPKYNPGVCLEDAIATNPIVAGMTPEQIDKAARDVIEFEVKKCSAISFAAGLPGGWALAGTVPADLVQYFAHAIRTEQKLAYLYGWHTFLNEDDEVSDETVFELVLLLGVMLGVGGAAMNLAKFAAEIAMPAIEKRIAQRALTKTIWYPVMQKTLKAIGINVTKSTFAKTASKVVPVVGGVISGGMTYASFKPSAERLRRHLRELPMSGIPADAPDAGRDGVSEFLISASDEASRAVSSAAEVAAEAGSAVARGAQAAGETVAETASHVGAAAADAAHFAGDAAARAAQGAKELFGSLRKR